MTPRLVVEPDAYTEAAGVVFSDVYGAVSPAVSRLSAVLVELGAMAGSDAGGVAWAAVYDPAATRGIAAGVDLANGLYRVGVLLEATGINHERAEAASMPGGAPPPMRWPHEPSYRVTASTPGRSAGGSGNAPFGWDLVRHLIGYVWPDGHQDRLRTAAAAWMAAADSISSAGDQVGLANVSIALQRSPEVDDALRVTNAMSGRCHDLAAAYRTLGAACAGLADHLDEAHSAVVGELRELLAWTAGIQLVGGLFSIVTAGLAEAPTQAEQAARIAATAALISRVLDRFVIAARTVAATVSTTEEITASIILAVERLYGGRIAIAGVTGARALPSTGRANRLGGLTAEMRAEKGLEESGGYRLGKPNRVRKTSVDRHSGRATKSADGGIPGASGNIGKVAKRFGLSRKQVSRQIHGAKTRTRKDGNADVVIDDAGDIYLLGRDGSAGEPIGSIFDNGGR